MSESRRLLLLLRRAPYATTNAAEAIEVGLVAAAFDLSVSVLFEGAGVWQLLAGQDGATLGMRTQSKILAALPHYEITTVYVCAESLRAAGLRPEDLVLAAKPVSRAEQRALIEAHDTVVND